MSQPIHPRIGVFDSGIGGLSVLRAVRQRLPGATLTYIADSRHTPWGERSADWVQARCQQLAGWLIDGPRAGTGSGPEAGTDLVLVACNTGTTQAIAALRARWPGCLFVGVEPGIKPAVAASRNRRVAVMATTGTLRSPRLQQLVQAHAGSAEVLQLPCPGLAEAIEAAGDDPARFDPQLDRQLDRIADILRGAQCDTVVLGCTHYPLVADALRRRLGEGVHLVDTAEAVAQRVASLLHAPIPDAPHPGQAKPSAALQLFSTADPGLLQRAARRWLGGNNTAQALDLPEPAPAARP